MEYIRTQCKPKDGKLLAIGHSMGGILLYAMLSRYGKMLFFHIHVHAFSLAFLNDDFKLIKRHSSNITNWPPKRSAPD